MCCDPGDIWQSLIVSQGIGGSTDAGGVLDLDAVVISLTRTSQRLIEFRDRFIGSPLVINHLEGVDGACLNLQVLLQQGVIEASVLRWPRGQVGCALSHLRAIHGVVARNRPLLILEDDASLRLIGTISSISY